MAGHPPESVEQDDFRWQAWFQRSEEGVYLLNRRRRLVFANRAWEKATGLLLKEVRGQICRRRPRSVVADKTESILGALAPPPEAWSGQVCQARRLLPAIGREGRWVQLAFSPLGSGESLLGIVGVIKSLPEPAIASPTPLPAKALAYRDRHGLPLDAWSSEAPSMARLPEQIRLAAAHPGLPIFLVGAAGTGKLSLARTIHQVSTWRERFFACLDCARLPPRAVAETLFADGALPLPLGSLLLEEPSALPREMQARIAQLAAEETPGVWLMAASRHEPGEEARAGRLLEELYARLGTLVIHLPTLQERERDLPRLTEMFLARAAAMVQPAPASLSAEALEILAHHHWPDNLKELGRVMFDAAERCGGERIEAAHLPLYLRGEAKVVERALPLDLVLEKVERRLIDLALRLAEGNKKKAADLLGIWRARLLRRMEGFGMGT